MNFDISHPLTSNANGFRLLKVKLYNNDILGNVEYNFCDLENIESNDTIFTTILIGPNGTGKSNLFRTIIKLFKLIYDLKNSSKALTKINGSFDLQYSLDGDIYRFTNVEQSEEYLTDDYYYMKNNYTISKDDFILPSSIIANSIMLNDKYPFYKESVFPIYNYLGVRYNPQSGSTQSFIRKTVESVQNNCNQSAFRRGIKSIIDYLNLENSLDIIYYTSNTYKFFNGKLEPSNLHEYFDNILEKYKKLERIPPFKATHYKKISNDSNLIIEICGYCNELFLYHKLENVAGSTIKQVRFDVLDDNSMLEFKSRYPIIEHMRELGMINYPEIKIKKNTKYSLSDSSSGEYHLFCTLICLLASIKEGSLLFIDEPEVSLHPNWQMKYIFTLKNIFQDYKNVHAIIATHSHFIVSDLQCDSSSIITLKRDSTNNDVIASRILFDPYGWSAEQILLEVFNTSTTRNYYIANKIGEILELISKKEENIEIIKQKVRNLMNANIVNLSSEDPLKSVISKLIDKYA